MEIIGIVAEYNPFHNGHLYQIEQIKKKYKDSTIIVVMNGNYTQRGEVTIVDKWQRAKVALNEGVDLIVELPYPFSTQSADYYAYGAITILEKLGCTKLIFGSESDNIDDLHLIAKAGLDDQVNELIKVYCKLGNNYPTAISQAIEDITGKRIDTPNDLLGISYIKTIIKNNYKIKPETIKRTNNYHSLETNNKISSASAIRNLIKDNTPFQEFIPKNTLSINETFHNIEDYFPLLKYKIITEENLDKYQTVDLTYSKKIKKVINECQTRDELIHLLKKKHDTYNKISRMLLHILCNFTKEKANTFKEITYIRILGFNTKGREYLNIIKKNIDIPIISKINKNKDQMLEFELETSKIYDIPYQGNSYEKEYNRKEQKND